MAVETEKEQPQSPQETSADETIDIVSMDDTQEATPKPEEKESQSETNVLSGPGNNDTSRKHSSSSEDSEVDICTIEENGDEKAKENAVPAFEEISPPRSRKIPFSQPAARQPFRVWNPFHDNPAPKPYHQDPPSLPSPTPATPFHPNPGQNILSAEKSSGGIPSTTQKKDSTMPSKEDTHGRSAKRPHSDDEEDSDNEADNNDSRAAESSADDGDTEKSDDDEAPPVAKRPVNRDSEGHDLGRPSKDTGKENQKMGTGTTEKRTDESQKSKDKKHKKKKKKKRDGKSHQLCKVCGDRASGKHYGVISCDGCRGFFKRAIRKKMGRLYRCKDNNSCIVDVSRRNQCQACRYRRCMEVKMNPNAVQKERSPRPPRDDSHVPTAIVPPEIGSGPYPHLLPNSSSFLCPYPGAPYPYPSNLYHYASASLYPRLAALQYQHHAASLANHLPPNPHVVLPLSNGSPELERCSAQVSSLSDTKEAEEEKERKMAEESSGEDEEVNVVEEKSPDSTTEREESASHPKSPDSGNFTASPHQLLSLSSEHSPSQGHNSSTTLSSSLNSTHSPESTSKGLLPRETAEVSAVAGDLGLRSKSPTASKASAFVVPTSFSWGSPVSSTSPVSSLSTSKVSSFVSVGSATRHLRLASPVYQSSASSGIPGATSLQSGISGSAGIPGAASLQYPGGHPALGLVPKPSLPLPLPFPGVIPFSMPLPAASSSPVNPKLPAFGHAHMPLPPTTSGAGFIETAASLAAAASFANGPRPHFPFPTPLPPPSWPTSPATGSLPSSSQLGEAEELQIATQALRVLQANVRWVAGLPTFTELSGRDRVVLLEQSWCELLVLSALQSSQLQDLVALVSGSGLHNKETVSVELMNIATRAHSLAIDNEEFNLLRCLALFRPERRGLGDPRTVETIQENATVMLNQHVQNLVPPVHAPGLRHTKLLLLLSDIQHLDAAAMGTGLFRRIPNALPVDNFVCNMFSMLLERR